ncbi:30S ribosomal protein S27ae [Candidatus Woesearchaeota archaeon]|nr:30S ribosomal protein S27ae [Candidatus Woesearchaeota archaeon]
MGKGAKSTKKGKIQRKPKKTSSKYKHYKVEGDKVTRDRTCPKCGAAVFLAKHKDRLTCGKCKYVEFISKK